MCIQLSPKPERTIRVGVGNEDSVDMAEAIFREPLRGRWQEALPDVYHDGPSGVRSPTSSMHVLVFEATLGSFRNLSYSLGLSIPTADFEYSGSVALSHRD